jgi:hypothetical protein
MTINAKRFRVPPGAKTRISAKRRAELQSFHKLLAK